MTQSSQTPPPTAEDVATLRDLLDATANYTDNDQRARYLLSSDFMQARQIDGRTEILAQLLDLTARMESLEVGR